MVWVDYAILAIIALSALISVLRGFVREALSLAGWILAFWVAITFASDFSVYTARLVSQPSLQMGLSFVILFVATLLLAGLVNFLAVKLIQKTGLTGTDRMLGVLFGIGRGAVIVGILVLMAGLTALPRDPWWSESMFLVHFQGMAIWIRGFLPDDIAAYFVY